MTRSIATPPWVECTSILRLPFLKIHWYPFILLGGERLGERLRKRLGERLEERLGERLGESVKYFVQEHISQTFPCLKPAALDPESGALTSIGLCTSHLSPLPHRLSSFHLSFASFPTPTLLVKFCTKLLTL